MSFYVGIGTSAGGLKALKKLLSNLPIDLGHVYLISQHLDKDKKSTIVEILSTYTTMPVLQADMKCEFLSNHVYILPPGYALKIKSNSLTLKKIYNTSINFNSSINMFLETLALYKKENSVGVVLTGYGQDGTLGLKKIKECGGVTIAQSPQEAEYKNMPQSAIDALVVDQILSIEEMTKYLSSEFFTNKQFLQTKISNSLKTIKELVNKHIKININIEQYKNETITRRIYKRMLLVNCKSMEEYIKYIKNNLEEVNLLYANILIGVTEFFRDADAFKSLENELYLYLSDKPENYKLRVWSIGCSSGEEAYSIAILVSQISKHLKKTFTVKIFATDMDNVALDKARKAFYSKDSLKNMNRDLLDEYFIPCENGYKVVPNLRQQIVFTQQNILNDPPFIKQDLIICRNLLIYILPEPQKEIFSLFHYSLKDNGLLFLGSSESTLNSAEYFNSLNFEHKIYKKAKITKPSNISGRYFSQHLKNTDDIIPKKTKEEDSLSMEEKLSNAVFNFFAPNCIVVDNNFSIIYKKGNLPFIKLPDGFATLNILDNLDETLRYDAGQLLKNAFKTNKTQTTKFIEMFLSKSQKVYLRIVAYPFDISSDNNMFLLYFQQLDADDLKFNLDNLTLPDEVSIIKSLNTQLFDAQQEVNTLSNELVVSKEGAQALSEELQSSNEELQSSNEELETSNEELRSSNDELQSSILKTQETQEQLSLIFNSSLEGIIGLDIDGNHTFINSAASKMLGFSENELLSKNAHQLWHHTKPDGSFFPCDKCSLISSLQNGISKKEESVFWRKDGTSFEVEISQNPIIKDNKTIGTVLFFHDVTEKNRLEKSAKKDRQLSDLFMGTKGTIVLTLDLNGNITMINKQGCELLCLKHDDIIGKNFINNFTEENLHDSLTDIFNDVTLGNLKIAPHHKNAIIDANGNKHIIAWTNNYLKDTDGNIIGAISSGLDITKEEKLRKQLFEQESLYKTTFEDANIGIAHVSLDGLFINTNDYLSTLLGYTKDEFKKLSFNDITYPDDIKKDHVNIKKLQDGSKDNYHVEKRYIHKNGNIIWTKTGIVLIKDEFDEPIYFLKFLNDISKLKFLTLQLEMEKIKLKNIIEFTPIPIMLYDEDDEILIINKVFKESIGHTKEEILDTNYLIKHLYLEKNRKNASEFFKKPFETRQLEKTKQIILNKSGEKRIWILNSILLPNTLNEEKRVVLTAIVDITELQDKENIMIAQSRQAAMGDMLAMISHQWKQPLSVILMEANNIQLHQLLDEEIPETDLKKFITTISEQTQYLSTTINDFGNFFKPNKRRENIMLSSIFSTLKTLIGKPLKSHSISLDFPTEQNIQINTYTNELLQVLINIINNAKDAILEHAPKNGFIKITVKKVESEIIIKISDNGGGINPSIEKTISQPYVSTKANNGTGLGLYMSKIIINKHLNGQLYWKSDEIGSSFYITLPLKKEEYSIKD